MITVTVGARIKELRLKQNLSQEKLAFASGLDRSYVAGVESGKRNASLRSLDKIVKALNVKYSEFFEHM